MRDGEEKDAAFIAAIGAQSPESSESGENRDSGWGKLMSTVDEVRHCERWYSGDNAFFPPSLAFHSSLSLLFS